MSSAGSGTPEAAERGAAFVITRVLPEAQRNPARTALSLLSAVVLLVRCAVPRGCSHARTNCQRQRKATHTLHRARGALPPRSCP